MRSVYTDNFKQSVLAGLGIPLTDSRCVSSFPSSGTDDTAQIAAAYAWLAGGPYRGLWFEFRQYIISGQLALTGAVNFRIFGNGASIKAADGSAAGAGTQMFYMTNSTDGEIYDLNYDGNRANRTPSETTSHLFEIYTGCARIDVFNCRADNAVCDGFYVGAQSPTSLNVPTDIRFFQCSADNGYRNCMSLINSVRFRDYDGVYTGANGTLPKAGVDVEPNSSTDIGNVDCQFHRTRFTGNANYGLQVTLANSQVKCFDIVSSGNTGGAVGCFSSGSLEIQGITMEDYTSSVTRGLIDVGSGSGYVSVDGIRINNCQQNNSAKPMIYVHAAATGPVRFSDIVQRNSKGPTLVSYLKAYVDGFAMYGDNNDYAFTLLGAKNSVLRNLYSDGSGAMLYTEQPCTDVENVKMVNPLPTGGLLFFAAVATRCSLKNMHVHQDVAVPAGQIGCQFAVAPLVLSNNVGTCDGTAYTAAQVRSITGTPSVSLGLFP